MKISPRPLTFGWLSEVVDLAYDRYMDQTELGWNETTAAAYMECSGLNDKTVEKMLKAFKWNHACRVMREGTEAEKDALEADMVNEPVRRLCFPSRQCGIGTVLWQCMLILQCI